MLNKKIIYLFTFVISMAGYTACLLFFSLPDNPLYLETNIDPEAIPRFLRQEWTLFAPNPVKNSYRVHITCPNGTIKDPIGDSIKNHKGLKFFSKEYYVYQGLADFLFEGISKETVKHCPTESVCTLAIYAFKMSKDFQDFKKTNRLFCEGENFSESDLKISLIEIKYPMYSRAKLKKLENRIMFND